MKDAVRFWREHCVRLRPAAAYRLRAHVAALKVDCFQGRWLLHEGLGGRLAKALFQAVVAPAAYAAALEHEHTVRLADTRSTHGFLDPDLPARELRKEVRLNILGAQFLALSPFDAATSFGGCSSVPSSSSPSFLSAAMSLGPSELTPPQMIG
eukprot:CAMPEP_0179002120 /NCGR_PEP_ID=MMETSP0795-20121207/11793_1 /TAXON_ID=88552 /ORGANISM="Amoebophrya sp., Strain Ameob2" /LENGTH=152 /DNA_ID=CAMNT_0020695677 /DNA_START=218 /DNA_END=674 /DNA_ORIENTATION=+